MWSESGPYTGVAILSVCLILRIQQTAKSRSEGSEPASKDRRKFSVWAYQALVFTYGITRTTDDLTDDLRLAAEQPQLTEDVVRRVHQSMFHLDAEEHRKVNANAEAHHSLQRLKVLPSESMVPCPHERKALARGHPSAMTDWNTLDLGQFWAQFTFRHGLHKARSSWHHWTWWRQRRAGFR